MNPYILKTLVLPAWQWINRQDSLEVLRHLERTQWLSKSELADLQWRRLGALLQHASRNVPYYRQIFEDRRLSPEAVIRERSVEALPLLDRSTVRQHLQRLRATNISADRFVRNGTGGSTGEPLQFFDDRNGAGWSDAAAWRSHRWYDVDVGDRCAYLWGANFDLTKFRGFTGRLRSRALNLLMLPAWDLSERTGAKFWRQLMNFKPRLLLAYAGSIYEWARFMGSQQSRIPSLRAIVVSAEMLHDDWRKEIEQCFKVPVYNRYGGRDIHFVAQECRSQSGLHINSELVLLEVVKNGQNAKPGETGELVITRLDNFAMPFIRYRTGDLGVMADKSCECGRSLPLLQKIEGRVQDTILTADGKIVSGPFFAHMMKDCPDVREFQIHQLALNHLRIILVLQSHGEFHSRDRIERIIRRYMGLDMRIEFAIHDSIPLTASGKRRITISHLASDEAPKNNGTDRVARTAS